MRLAVFVEAENFVAHGPRGRGETWAAWQALFEVKRLAGFRIEAAQQAAIIEHKQLARVN